MPADGHAFLSVMSLLLADGLYNRFCSPRGRGHVETPWWLVYVFSAPLLFSSTSPPAHTLALICSLYATRFAVEALQTARGHWAVRVASSTRTAAELAPLLRRRSRIDEFGGGGGGGDGGDDGEDDDTSTPEAMPYAHLRDSLAAAVAGALCVVDAGALHRAFARGAASSPFSLPSSSSTRRPPPGRTVGSRGAPVLSGFEIPEQCGVRGAKAAQPPPAAAAALHGPELWPMSARWPPRLRIFRVVHPRVT